MSRIERRISAGPISGVREGGIDRYLGIPYAAAPVGDLRFQPPAPATAWTAPRDASELGPTAPQNPYAPGIAELLANVQIDGDDFLNVNIWAPADAETAPVMVWVHGGSYAHGSNALDGYDGSAFARDGVVFVGVNYRLGSEGFSVLDDASTNLGLADVEAALSWVRQEISAFGGDPDNVTAFGESAGSTALGTLLAAPDARRLFDRVILQSAMPAASKRRVAGRTTRKVAKFLGIPARRSAFVQTTPDDLLRAEAALTQGANPLTGGVAFQNVIGDRLVPTDPMQALIAGAASEIPTIIGWNTEEYRLWFLPSGLLERFPALLFNLARLRFRIGRRVLAAYKRAHPSAGRGELFGNIAMDVVLRLPARRLLTARREKSAPTWAYEFAWRSPVSDLGAAHVMELGFVFDRLSSADWQLLDGDDAPQHLADDMHAAWVRFATTGDPGWRKWGADRTIMRFDTQSAEVTADGPDELDAW